MIDHDFVNTVRLQVLDEASKSGRVPDARAVAETLGRPEADVVAAFEQLGQGHVYVVEPDDPARLRMANPFAAVETPFGVEVGLKTYFGNCIWDALGIVSLLGGTGLVRTTCPDCGDRLVLAVKEHVLARPAGVVHFGVPARLWWDDIVHT